MIGAPPGYVGYEEGGQLTEAVRRRPYSVILFDEIEKAHPDVFNVLLQILDDGRLTDSQGRLVDFRNTVIIMTSNIGSQLIVDAGAQADDAAWARVEQRVRDELRNHFRPEFLNRVDDIIVFRPLSREDLVADRGHPAAPPREAAGRRGTSRLEVTPEAGSCWRDAGLRSGVRRPAAQAGDPARAAEPDRAGAARGQVPRGRHVRVEREGDHLRLARRAPRSPSGPVRRGTPSPSDLPGCRRRSAWPGRPRCARRCRSAR